MRTLHRTLFCLALIAVSACNTAAKRANEYMEKGLYDDAIRTYQGILARNPNDTDAAAGLKKAEAEWIDHRLIDVRMTRLAGSGDKALDMLLDIENREAQWGTEPMGNVAFTQNEETSYGIQFADKFAADAVAQKLPLKGEVFLLRYQKLFGGGEVAGRYQAARARTRAAGKISCASLLPKKPDELAGKHPYYYAFLRGYCDYWGTETPEPPNAAKRYLNDYASAFSFSALGVVNLPADIRAYLGDQAKTAFQRTAWYDQSGAQVVALNVSGSYTLYETKQPQELEHVYTEQVPYTVYRDVQKTREVPYNETENVYDQYSKLYKPIVVTKYRTETYSEQEPETRYRDVQRTFHYQGFEHDRKITLAMSSQFSVLSHPLDLELSDASQTGGIEHDENQPTIGLTPQHPNLQDVPAWLKAESGLFTAQLEKKLSDLWRDTYCQATGAEDIAVAGDAAQHCLRQKSQATPAFADAWYQKNFGVTAVDASSVLGGNK
jgi:hypothetical protein